MNLARSSFYYKPQAKSPDRMKAEADLMDRIEAVCLEFLRYGYRRVTKQLQREGWTVNHKKVLKIMRESDLLCRVKRRCVKTTDSNHRFPRYPNLIKEMMAGLPYFIEEVYNQKRLHSALGCQSPNDFEESLLIQPNMVLPRQTLLTLPV